MAYKDTKNWRQKYPERRYADKAYYYARSREKTGDPTRRPWTDSEIAKIMAEVRPCDRDLSHIIGRSIQAIQVMRNRIKKRKIKDFGLYKSPSQI